MRSFFPPPARPCALLAAALLVGACGESSPLVTGDFETDRTAPAVALAPMRDGGSAPGGSDAVRVQVVARDNLGLRRVRVVATQRLPIGRDTTVVGLDTTFSAAVTDFAQTVAFAVPAGTPPGTQVSVTAFATDGAGNASTEVQARVATGNLEPPRARVSAPTPGSLFVIGKSGLIGITASARLKVRGVGYQATGAFTAGDSTIFREPLRDSVSVLDTLVVPTTARAGVLTVTPFVIDSLGQRATGTPVAFAIQPIDSVNSLPVVTSGLTRRVEVRDTIRVAATDPTGIRAIGYEVVDTTTRRVIAADSALFSGDLTVNERTFTFNLPIANFPTPVQFRAFARNMANRRAYAKLPSGLDRADSALVVAGLTRPLPNGGVIADGVYVPRYDRLYLTNIERNQLEVFSLGDTSFKRAIVVGSRPWGIVPWPRNRLGEMGDTLLVANSGGTNVSYVQIGGDGSGAEVYRYPLPNIIAYSITTERSSTTGDPMQTRTVYDFSDRPQFLAATCDTRLTGSSACGDVTLVYSTTPTGGQSVPFPNKGTVRWENLTRCTSHFFFEQAVGQDARRADTLEIVRFAAHPSYRLPVTCAAPFDSTVLVPYQQEIFSESGQRRIYSVVVRLQDLAFRDTTFVRNSGNFARAILGEGGAVRGSRAISYDADRGFMTDFTLGGQRWFFSVPTFDLGISRSKDVSDFIANAFATVRGVAINFDGALSAIRGDSTYLLDPQLRLQGLMQTSGGQNAGFDFHPRNEGQGNTTTDVSTRLAFSASMEPMIEVYDTFCYQRLGTIQVRDPIIGPIKASRRPNGDIILVGASARGVVMVRLDRTFASGCTPS